MEKQNQPQIYEPGSNWAYRGRSFANLLRMGYCAPTVMQTIQDISSTEKEWLVWLSAGMPGSIANTGFECGGVTSPLVLMGVHYELRQDERINKFNRSMNRGHRLSKWFSKAFGSTQCQAITQCDFSCSSGVSNYIEGNRIARCREIAAMVAEKVQKMLA